MQQADDTQTLRSNVGLDVPQEDFEVEEEETPPTQEEMEEVALQALGRITIQELINDSVSALVEVYKVRPESFQYDASHFDDENANTPSPFLDLLAYLEDIRNNGYARNSDT